MKESPAKTAGDHQRTDAMLTPTFRFVALPLAAVLTLAALAIQPADPKAAAPLQHAQASDCSALQAGDFCVVESQGS